MQHIAFIGTREPELLPREWVDLYLEAVHYAVSQGFTIITGAAKGYDQLAAEAASTNAGRVKLVLPWPSYEQEWLQYMAIWHPHTISAVSYCGQREWFDSVHKYHLTPWKLGQGDIALHARNYGIVKDAKVVVALPSTKPGGGGTGQGIRVAQGLDVPSLNLTVEADRAAMRQYMKDASC